jgi:hypothetical protein
MEEITMEQLLTINIPRPCSYLLWAFAAALSVRVYITVIEAWSRGRKWFWPVLLGTGKSETDNGPILAADRLTGLLIGFLEAVAYPILIKVNQPEYIGAWLAFKTVNRWQYRRQDRGLFNRYLVANALLLVAGYILARSAL